jgi:hypothetical protein
MLRRNYQQLRAIECYDPVTDFVDLSHKTGCDILRLLQYGQVSEREGGPTVAKVSLRSGGTQLRVGYLKSLDNFKPQKNMTLPTRITKLAIGVGAISLVAGSTFAGDYGKAIIDDKMPIEAWEFCDIFDIPTIYESDSGFIRSVALTGRYQGQWISQSEDIEGDANGYHEFQHRRFRQGIEVGFANDISLSVVMNITDGSGGDHHGLTYGRFFDDFDTFELEWAPSKDTYVIVGKQKQKVTMENATSSSKILTIERSAITNEVVSDKPWGVTYGFKALGIKHELGAYIYGADEDNSTGRDGDPEGYLWPDFESRGGVTYRASAKVTEATELSFGYIFTNNSGGSHEDAGQGNADAGLGSQYEHVFSVGTKTELGEFGLITDIIVASNREDDGGLGVGNDTWGLVILPYYNFTDKLQGVARYAYMDEGREQRPQRFNERDSVENYHTFYAGLNYYICGNNLKVQGGYEYATGDILNSTDEVDTGTWMLGLRMDY